MYLAGILGLCALLHVSVSGQVGGGLLSFDKAAVFYQEPAQQPSTSDTPTQPTPSQPDDKAAPAPRDPTHPAGTGKQTPPESTQLSSSNPKAGAAGKKSSSRKKHTTGDGDPQKRVIHRGGTVEPTTQLAQGMTEEQAAHQRETTNKLLATTEVSLQKLSRRLLTKDEQDTVAQIKRFMQQVKTADAAGDLQRAYKLAVKAHLLSDALAKP